jgi:two-component system, NtrC family, response regulator GlrR
MIMEDKAKFTILVVDDEEEIRKMLVFDFKRQGFNALSAGNVPEALKFVQKEKIDLVLSDMRMPGEDGLSLLEKIRSINPSTPIVIFLTGFADLTDEECIAKGASRIFSKPYDRKALMKAIFELLGLP